MVLAAVVGEEVLAQNARGSGETYSYSVTNTQPPALNLSAVLGEGVPDVDLALL